MNENLLIEHQIKTVNTICDALFGKVPDVPAMIVEAQHKAKLVSRMDDLVEIADFIGTASLLECKHIINELIDRTSTITGCATELENASCALTLAIEAEGGE